MKVNHEVTHEVTVKYEAPIEYEDRIHELPPLPPDEFSTRINNVSHPETLDCRVTLRWGTQPSSVTVVPTTPNAPIVQTINLQSPNGFKKLADEISKSRSGVPTFFIGDQADNVRAQVHTAWAGVNIAQEAWDGVWYAGFKGGVPLTALALLAAYFVKLDLNSLSNDYTNAPLFAALTPHAPFSCTRMGHISPYACAIALGVCGGICEGIRTYYQQKSSLVNAQEIDSSIIQIIDWKEEVDTIMQRVRSQKPPLNQLTENQADQDRIWQIHAYAESSLCNSKLPKGAASKIAASELLNYMENLPEREDSGPAV